MTQLLKIFIGFTAIISMTSCGYTSTEDDKHPDMPVFPEHTNPNIKIEALGMKIDSIYDIGNDKLLLQLTFMTMKSLMVNTLQLWIIT